MAEDTGSWSRAFMASSGVSVTPSKTQQREKSAEWHEAISARLPRDRLRELAGSRSSAVREAIASRSDCPLGMLATLAHDHRVAVRIAVAANTATTRAIVEHLMGDRDASVVKALARNDSTPVDLIERIATHRKADVRRVAARRLDAMWARAALPDAGGPAAADVWGFASPSESTLSNDRPSLAHAQFPGGGNSAGAPPKDPETGESSPTAPTRHHIPAMLAPRPEVTPTAPRR